MKNKGFTLLELVIVIAVILIMSAGGIWALKNRLYKNEKIRLRTAVPTLIDSTALKVYEKSISGAGISIESNKISATGSNFTDGYKNSISSSLVDFSVSTGGIESTSASFSIAPLGAFYRDFEIILKRKGISVMKFKVTNKTNWGVYNISITDLE